MDSSYIPIYPYSSEISSFRSNINHISTNDYSSYYPDNSRSDRCLVCNDRSSGIHFGVSTCEACKAFFRRTNLSTYTIPRPCSPTRCEINIKNRNNCPSCRFDKCKRLGMDRDNVIYGKPSKQQNTLSYQQLTNILNELIKIFQNIHSIDNKQQIDIFGQIAFQLFYEQTPQIHVSKARGEKRDSCTLKYNGSTREYGGLTFSPLEYSQSCPDHRGTPPIFEKFFFGDI